MKNKLYLLSVICLGIISCIDKTPDAREIMDQAMQSHGTSIAGNGTLEFNFRGIDYSATRENGRFTYKRHLTINTDSIIDQLDNDGFTRFKNNQPLHLADSLSTRYAASLNSVVYFAQLPYSLDGDAIYVKYISQDTIQGQAYHEIEVTFDEDGGGEDHEDVFMYWVNVDDFFIDYLAYSYCEEECGYRFRESENRRNLNGVTIQDYNNYKSEKAQPDLSKMDDLFEEDKLIKLSDIDLKRAEFTKN
ncbi:hypothetical protein LX97_03058 [Nonlabens dokdonensis]|jgi:hypothetical protein|uniref:SsrA-binding protein n=2 Tax=Nonlabens dokdonensis TaxID=328515 RepID=L7WDF4_NONDD|nr:DUF6503 family protein [Nonlabens dokdonensis]AGC77966.1 SsrA-binding protein [Nonlabens dokdonensis DSW-6]PZX37037.1 hypothetical protein LX97_03058 [Nonlabens dokdonensis]